MYSHTTGPRESPKTAINKKRPKRINAWPGPPSWSPLIKNPTVTSRFATP